MIIIYIMLLSLALYIILLFINTYCSLSCFGFISWRSFPSLVFPAQSGSFSIYCKAGLVVLNSLNFCLSGKLLISPSNLKKSLAGQSILGCRFFPFITGNMVPLSSGLSLIHILILLPQAFNQYLTNIQISLLSKRNSL